jgi:predicted nucleic acid-binding protein
MPDALLVVNASPLIFLGNAGHLELLHRLGASRIIVPEPVFDEVMAGGYTDNAAKAISDASWLERRPSPPIPESVVAWEIGKGESSVIATALHEPSARVVIDDLNGRKCALAHGLAVVGTLGVVIAAHRQGRIDDPRAVLLELRTAGMWLSDAVIARVLRTAGINS